MMPNGLEYVSSWIDLELNLLAGYADGGRIALRLWIDNWKDLVDFEIVPVRASADAVQMMEKRVRD